MDFSGRTKTPTVKKSYSKLINNNNKSLDELEDEDIEEKKDVKFNMNIASDTLLDPLVLSEQNLLQQLKQVEMGCCEKLVWRAAEVKHHFRLLWRAEAHALKLLFPFFDEVILKDILIFKKKLQVEGGYPVDILFCESILVEPPKFRPIRHMGGEAFEHPFTVNLRKLLEADQLLTIIKVSMSLSMGINVAAKVKIKKNFDTFLGIS